MNKIYQIGNSIVEIVAPQITEEERQRRLEEIQQVAWIVWNSLEDHERNKIITKYNTDKED